MDKTTFEVRLKEWTRIVEQCHARPENQSARQWLAENGINERSYYYWQRHVRKLAYEEANAVPAVPATDKHVSQQPVPLEDTVSFAEVPFSTDSGSVQACDSSFQPAAVIKTDSLSIAFSNSVSASLLSGIVREVLSHA